MFFDFKLGLKHSYHALFKANHTNYALKPKRILVLFIFYFFFPILELFTWTGLFLDELFFPNYKKQKLKSPIFVIGNYRSGTTFLHRLLATDYKQFTSMSGWEIIIAASITQRKLLKFFGIIDRFLGNPILRTFDFLWGKYVQGEVNFHKLGVSEPEEDESLFAHIWSGIIPWNLFPIMEKDRPPSFATFDKWFSEKEKSRVMTFYKLCLQRHVYYHGGKKIYLSKSPSFSGNVEAILKTFPDAKFVYLIRSPLEVIPSSINLWSFKWHLTCDPEEEYPFKENLLKMIKYWYTHPWEVLKGLPTTQVQFVHYNKFVRDPFNTVTSLYTEFGLKTSKIYLKRLEREIRLQNRNYRPNQNYPLHKMGLSKLWIWVTFQDVFRKYQIESARLCFSIKLKKRVNQPIIFVKTRTVRFGLLD
jgi:hypothetical protein